MSAPVTLYSPDGKRTREIAAIDAPGWIRAGWLFEPPVLVQSVAAPDSEAEDLHEPVPTILVPDPVAQSTTKSKRNDVPRDGVSEG